MTETTPSPNRLPHQIDDLDRQIAAAKAKLASLKERTDSLDRHAEDAQKQLGELVERLTAFGAEVIAIQQEIIEADRLFDAVSVGLGDVRAEAGNAAVLEATHQTLSTMFGEAFQVVSRFFETAQRLGLVGKDAAIPFPPYTPSLSPLPEEAPSVVEEPPKDSFLNATELADWHATLETDGMPPPVAMPPLPDVSVTDSETDSNIKDVEALLAGLSTPIST